MNNEFPILDKDFIYLDSAATSLKPYKVIQAESNYYMTQGFNVGRGTSLYNFSATNEVEKIRRDVASYIGSSNPQSLIFTSNSTDSINLVALGYVKSRIKPDSNIVITQLEHHSNYSPWINLCKEHNIECRVIPLKKYSIDYSYIDSFIDQNTILTAVTGMSNVTGESTDLITFSNRCKATGSKLLVDGAQLVVHKRIDVVDMNIDFFNFSAHKIYGPFGLGFLYVNPELLGDLKPVKTGGNTIAYINNLDEINYKDAPNIFEAGTQNPAAISSMAEVLIFLKKYPIYKSEITILELYSYIYGILSKDSDITIYSKPGSIFSFNIKGVHPHDASEFFDRNKIIVRAGNLCASPFFNNLQESGVIRISMGIYNTKAELDRVINTIHEIKEFFL